jgi:hypothetical protein
VSALFDDPVHAALLGGAIVASFIVAVGIVMESHKFWALATLLVLGGVSAEAVLTISLFMYDEGISREQQSTIEAQNREIIALQKKIASRSFTDGDVRAFSDKLKPFSGTFVDVYIFPAGTPDTVPLGSAIASALTAASWNVARVQTAAGGQYVVGMAVWVNPNADEKVKAAHAALIKALASFEPTAELDMNVIAGAFSVRGLALGTPPAQLAVLVGTKP